MTYALSPPSSTYLYSTVLPGEGCLVKNFHKGEMTNSKMGVLAIEPDDTNEHAHIRSGMGAFICLESLKLRATGAVLLLQR